MKKEMTPTRNILIGTFIALIATSTISFGQEKEVDPKSIYARLGGEPAMNAAVDLFYKKILADERIKFHFDDINMDRQIRKQKTFLSAAFGGPVAYEGKDLRRAHKYLDLTEKDFAAVAENLQATLNDLKVNKELQKEIMTLVASTKDAVLNKEPKEND